MSKTFDELTFSDDWMFKKVLEDPGVCAELIERLLHIRVNHVEYPALEKVIAPYYTSKGVRLDVYIKDSDKVIDIEIQSYPMEALGKRIRYYESMLNMDSLMKGQDYVQLKDSYILFICKDDPFMDENENCYGLPCYTFRIMIYLYTVPQNDAIFNTIFKLVDSKDGITGNFTVTALDTFD